MVELSEDAQEDLRSLRNDFERKQRPEAAINLAIALADAIEQIERSPGSGLPAPRPYPHLAIEGRLWIKRGRYWFRYRPRPPPPVIVAIAFDTSDLPRRMRE